MSITEKIRQKPNKDNTLDDFESAFGIDDKEIPGQAFVRVMRGCDKFCSYCVVPYVRGVEVSRPPTIIIEQIKKQITSEGETAPNLKKLAELQIKAELLEQALKTYQKLKEKEPHGNQAEEKILKLELKLIERKIKEKESSGLSDKKEEILKLGNLKLRSNEYRIRVTEWINPKYAREVSGAEIAGIEVVPR